MKVSVRTITIIFVVIVVIVGIVAALIFTIRTATNFGLAAPGPQTVSPDKPEVQLANQYCSAVMTQNYVASFGLFSVTQLPLKLKDNTVITNEQDYAQKAGQIDQDPNQGTVTHCFLPQDGDTLTSDSRPYGCTNDACFQVTKYALRLQVTREHEMYSVNIGVEHDSDDGRYLIISLDRL